MEANRRNYYGECVAYIAALGEVLESMGHENAKQKLMTSYREKYPRRSAFVAELRAYGWIDLKRKKKQILGICLKTQYDAHRNVKNHSKYIGCVIGFTDTRQSFDEYMF